MRLPVALIITLPEPCGEDWDAMTPAAGGRHCAACQKTVTDFTGWSDAAIAAFYSKPEHAAACGRFLNTQLDRPLHLPHQPHSLLYRWVLAAGLAVITLAALPAAAQTGHPPVPHTTVPATGASDTAPARRVLTAAELEKLPVRTPYPRRPMGPPPRHFSRIPPAPRVQAADTVRTPSRPDTAALAPPLPGSNIEKMPRRNGAVTVGAQVPSWQLRTTAPAMLLPHTNGTYSGDAVDRMHLRSPDDLLR